MAIFIQLMRRRMTKTDNMLPAVAAVLPAENGNETLVKWGLLPCCRFSGTFIYQSFVFGQSFRKSPKKDAQKLICAPQEFTQKGESVGSASSRRRDANGCDRDGRAPQKSLMIQGQTDLPNLKRAFFGQISQHPGMVWLIAFACLGLVGVTGYYSGPIRAGFSLVGLFFGVALAGPLSPLTKHLLPLLGLAHPLWQLFVPQALAFLIVVIIFIIAGGVAHRKLCVHLSTRWTKKNSLPGNVCIAGLAYASACSTALFIFS